MKVIFKNSNLVFEKALTKVNISSYDAFGCAIIAASGNITSVDASASDKKCQLFNVSQFAGESLYVEVHWNISPNDTTNKRIFAFSTSAVTHEDATGELNVLTMDNGFLTSEGLTKTWVGDTVHCIITGEINIPANTVAMAIVAGEAQYTGVAYPDNSKVWYYE